MKSLRQWTVVAMSVTVLVLGATGSAFADATSIMEYEGYFTSGGPGNTGENISPHYNGGPGSNPGFAGATWTKDASGCCALNGGSVDDTKNILAANSEFLGTVQIIGNDQGGINPNAPPDFTGTTLSWELVDDPTLGEGYLFTADFTNATNLAVNWQIVKITIHADGLKDGIFVTTNQFTAQDLVQHAFISDDEYHDWTFNACLVKPCENQFSFPDPVISNFTALGVAGTRVPEPSMAFMFGAGLVGIGMVSLKRLHR